MDGTVFRSMSTNKDTLYVHTTDVEVTLPKHCPTYSPLSSDAALNIKTI